ncbi:MAG: TldD/PmbA family protein [bacterium]
MFLPEQILEKIKSIDEAEVFLSKSKSLTVDVLDGQVESIDEIRDQGLGIRVIKGKKLGFAFTSDLDESAIENTINQAIENAKNSAPDEFNTLPSPHSSSTPRPSPPFDSYDPKIAQVPIKAKIDLALSIEKAAYKASNKVKKTEKISYSEAESEVWIANSKGLKVTYKDNNCGAFGDVIAIQNTEMESGFGMDYVTNFDDLNFEAVGTEAAKRAVQLLGAKSISSQKVPLVIDPYVATQLLGVLAAPLSSEAVQKGKSLFAGKIDQAIGSELLTIIDNGRLPKRIGSAPFDGEGVPTQETKLIEAGQLKTFFYNTYTAKKGKTKSTGNASRGSFQGLPVVGPTNLYIKAGTKSHDEIIKSITKGLYIVRVMGVHTANPISGDFSFGAAGIMIENGKLTQPVRGITIAGNLIDLLKHLKAVGSNLRFFANVGAPTLLFDGMTISG